MRRTSFTAASGDGSVRRHGDGLPCLRRLRRSEGLRGRPVSLVGSGCDRSGGQGAGVPKTVATACEAVFDKHRLPGVVAYLDVGAAAALEGLAPAREQRDYSEDEADTHMLLLLSVR